MMYRKQVIKFQNEILHWYKKHKRDLPWRGTRDPYRILVSEIMLQQTQVSRVIPKYEEWLKKFPTIEVLAKASMRDVLRVWSGLGYNRRALYLKRSAVILSEAKDLKRFFTASDAVQKDKVEQLRKLPGIGEYTARAIACFAFDKQVAVVDTNVRKVILLHVIARSKATRQSTKDRHTNARDDKREIQLVADQLLPKDRAYDWNHALMDYSAAMLKNHKVPLRRQTRFVGSNRYYRGQIIKLLITRKKLTRTELERIFKKNTELSHIINGLVRDGLIERSQKTISLAS